LLLASPQHSGSAFEVLLFGWDKQYTKTAYAEYQGRSEHIVDVFF